MTTRDKRASAININGVWSRVYPNPNNALTLPDWQQTALSYRLENDSGSTQSHLPIMGVG